MINGYWNGTPPIKQPRGLLIQGWHLTFSDISHWTYFPTFVHPWFSPMISPWFSPCFTQPRKSAGNKGRGELAAKAARKQASFVGTWVDRVFVDENDPLEIKDGYQKHSKRISFINDIFGYIPIAIFYFCYWCINMGIAISIFLGSSSIYQLLLDSNTYIANCFGGCTCWLKPSLGEPLGGQGAMTEIPTWQLNIPEPWFPESVGRQKGDIGWESDEQRWGKMVIFGANK